jgi:hypothetical protein
MVITAGEDPLEFGGGTDGGGNTDVGGASEDGGASVGAITAF